VTKPPATAEWTPPPANWGVTNFKGITPESWHCIDCGVNTAPGCLNRAELEDAARALGKLWETNAAGVPQRFGDDSEVYTVRDAVWKRAGVEPMGGCLCVGCLERRIGRRLKPKDFVRDHPFSELPGTPRLLSRRGRPR
jgi:hypothetical protein